MKKTEMPSEMMRSRIHALSTKNLEGLLGKLARVVEAETGFPSL